MFDYFKEGGIRSRSKFETGADSRLYAWKQYYPALAGQIIVAACGLKTGTNIVDAATDTDPYTHPTVTGVGLLTTYLVATQFLHNRSEAANIRRGEWNDEFVRRRDAELAQRSGHVKEWSEVKAEIGAQRELAGDSAEQRETSEQILQRTLSQGEVESPQEQTISVPPPENPPNEADKP